MTEYDVGGMDELSNDGDRLLVKLGQREVGVFRVHGRFYALANVCFHQGGPLCAGRITGTLTASADGGWKQAWVKDGEIIVCPWHSIEFEITSGRCLARPDRAATTFEVIVRDGRIIVVA